MERKEEGYSWFRNLRAKDKEDMHIKGNDSTMVVEGGKKKTENKYLNMGPKRSNPQRVPHWKNVGELFTYSYSKHSIFNFILLVFSPASNKLVGRIILRLSSVNTNKSRIPDSEYHPYMETPMPSSCILLTETHTI